MFGSFDETYSTVALLDGHTCRAGLEPADSARRLHPVVFVYRAPRLRRGVTGLSHGRLIQLGSRLSILAVDTAAK